MPEPGGDHVTVVELNDAIRPLIDGLQRSRRAIVIAPPGVGKTTRLPLLLLDAMQRGALHIDGKILMLEPRRVAAVAAARFMSKQLGRPLGDIVGYRIRGDRQVSPTTRIEVVTERLLIRQLQRDPELRDIGAVIFDEVHERSLSTDLGFALSLDVATALRDDLAIIAMSATPDVEPLKRALTGSDGGTAAPVVVEVTSRHHEIDTIYLGRDHRRPLVYDVVDAVQHALKARPDGDVLVFLPGRREIRRCTARLRTLGIEPIGLWGGADRAALEAALAPAVAGTRRVLLSTSVAQTSVTIDGVSVVVDSGQERYSVHDRRSGIDELVTRNVSLAAATQRAGRAGRLGPGTSIRLWNPADERHFRPHSLAEIDVADLSGLVLDLAHWGVRNPDELTWLTPPDPVAFAEATNALVARGCLDADHRITERGRRVVELGVSPPIGVMLLEGQRRGHLDIAAALAAALEDGVSGDLTRAVQAPSDEQRRVAAQMRSLLAGGSTEDTTNVPAGSFHVDEFDDLGHLDDIVAAVLVSAFPVRVARRRNDSDRWLSVGGLEFASTAPAGAQWCVVGDVITAANGPIIGSYAVLSPRMVTHLSQQATERAELIEVSTHELSSRRVRALGAIVLSQRPEAPDRADTIDAIVALISRRGVRVIGWDDAADRLQARAAFASRFDATIPDVSDDALAAQAPVWVPSAAHGVASATRIRLDRVSAAAALSTLLDWQHAKRIDRLAPATIEVPSGRHVRVDYTPEGPVVAVKLQEMFGATTTPTVGDGTTPVTLHLLSPAGRPLQVTSDLAGFWSGSYRQVRGEMRGRYPKHPWPDDPANATATARVKHPRGR